MIKTLIIEDEIEAKQALVKLLDYLNLDITIVGHTTSIHNSLKFLSTHEIDLALVDIELSDGISFELFRQLPAVDFKVIFTTAFSKYAIQAFKVNALDYLLKPIDPQDLKDAVKKAIKQTSNDEAYKKLLEVSKEKEHQRIVLKTAQQHYIVDVRDIIRIEAQGSYTKFVTNTQSILVSKNLRYYESLFTEFTFIRPHNSHLINQNHILKIKSNVLIMSNNEAVPISTRKRSEINKLLIKA